MQTNSSKSKSIIMPLQYITTQEITINDDAYLQSQTHIKILWVTIFLATIIFNEHSRVCMLKAVQHAVMMTSSNGNNRSPVNSPHKGQWRGALMFSLIMLICVWINGWVNNREAGDLGSYRAHYDVIVMVGRCLSISQIHTIIIGYQIQKCSLA